MAFKQLWLRDHRVVERMEERSRPGPNMKVPSLHLAGETEENTGKTCQNGRRWGLNQRPSECETNGRPLSSVIYL
jgi:hypothetical protein